MPSAPAVKRIARIPHWVITAALALCALLAVTSIALAVAARQFAPTARRRILTALQAQLGSPVHIGPIATRFHGKLIVDMEDLQAQSVLRNIPGDPAHPMLRVRHATVRIGLLDALFNRMNLTDAQATGIIVELPPLPPNPTTTKPGVPSAIHLANLTLDDAHLTFLPADPTRAPRRVGRPPGQLHGRAHTGPTPFTATVDAGDPIGNVQTTGTLGPWQTTDPRATPIQGTFTFDHRSVASVRGLRGILSMQARYHGTLAQLQTEGDTQDPAFGLDISAHTIPLRTHYLMTIDAVQGIVHLQSVDAHFLHTEFQLRGDITKHANPDGYVLDLALHVPEGRIEDGLLLAAATAPPLLRGDLTMDGKLSMSAGPESVSRKLQLRNGTFHLTDTRFGNTSAQHSADSMSERASGHPEDANRADASPSTANANGALSLSDRLLHLTGVHLTAPGAQLLLAGTYHLGGTAFAMAGTLHTDAKASDMNTGLKGWLTRPFNGLFAHGRPGATFPFQVTGTGNTPHFQVTLPGGKKLTAID